jgi:hypothetical protein
MACMKQSDKSNETDLFLGARLKIERAETHIADLRDLFSDFVEENPHTLVTKTEPDTGNLIFKCAI